MMRFHLVQFLILIVFSKLVLFVLVRMRAKVIMIADVGASHSLAQEARDDHAEVDVDHHACVRTEEEVKTGNSVRAKRPLKEFRKRGLDLPAPNRTLNIGEDPGGHAVESTGHVAVVPHRARGVHFQSVIARTQSTGRALSGDFSNFNLSCKRICPFALRVVTQDGGRTATKCFVGCFRRSVNRDQRVKKARNEHG